MCHTNDKRYFLRTPTVVRGRGGSNLDDKRLTSCAVLVHMYPSMGMFAAILDEAQLARCWGFPRRPYTNCFRLIIRIHILMMHKAVYRLIQSDM